VTALETDFLDPFSRVGSPEQWTAAGALPASRVQDGGVAPSEWDLREALGEFLTGGGVGRPVRAEIVESWHRVASRGLRPDRFEPSYDPDVERDGRLERAAAPVMARLAGDLAGTETSLLLTDERAHVVDRRVSDGHLLDTLDHILLAPGFFYDEEGAGTNGIGSALAEAKPVFVRGAEHFADVLTDMACAGAPVTDPRNGHVLGVIDVTVPIASANSLMLPFAKRAAWDIEQRLLEGASAIERVLHERFLQARRRVKGPLALVSEYMMMTNTAAARTLDPSDQTSLWEWALRAIAAGGRQSPDLTLVSGVSMSAECEAVDDGGIVIGALIRLRSRTSGPSGGARRVTPAERPVFGWNSLTESERSVADLVAEGLTNREVAARLFISPHTVDAHLRHIYRKLGIGSRVELTRVVAEQTARPMTAPL
jgi:DNA-binding CsgD family transcriptional regulator